MPCCSVLREMSRDALEREAASEAAPEAVRQAVGGGCQSGWGGYCRLQMPLKLRFGVRGTVAGHRLGALEGLGGLPKRLGAVTVGYKCR